MISLANRAEKQCVDTLLADSRITSIYGTTKIFQGYVAPNTLATYNEYIYLRRISGVVLDQCTDGTPSDKLRRVRLQIDVSDVDYAKMITRSELVRSVMTASFPDCIDGDTYGTITNGTKAWNVSSIDVFLNESEE